jgi:hypothetical protein
MILNGTIGIGTEPCRLAKTYLNGYTVGSQVSPQPDVQRAIQNK